MADWKGAESREVEHAPGVVLRDMISRRDGDQAECCAAGNVPTPDYSSITFLTNCTKCGVFRDSESSAAFWSASFRWLYSNITTGVID